MPLFEKTMEPIKCSSITKKDAKLWFRKRESLIKLEKARIFSDNIVVLKNKGFVAHKYQKIWKSKVFTKL